ncbi:hypothetical protein GGR53DRAFT_468626 [Hypoxylon sp. FL1150]|nr:hypothetical protein GGR53DRAFT_468626 [Hypoxylon sp. FL1150]
MSDTTAAGATEKELGPFERLPLEAILQIFSSLPNLKSVLNLGLASRDFHSILTKNEGAIARGFATTVLGHDDPGLLKLAFMACEARIIDLKSKDSIAEFIHTYVQREAWLPELYRFRALHALPKINMAIKLVIDWIGTYGTLWPLKLESKAYTQTEITRIERIVYIFEVSVTLFQAIKNILPKNEFFDLCDPFWVKFSRIETCILDAMLDLLAPTYYWRFKALLESTGRGKCGPWDWPWTTCDVLGDTLNCIQKISLVGHHGRPWHRWCKIIQSMRHSQLVPGYTNLYEGRKPFAQDPTAHSYTYDNWIWIHGVKPNWNVHEKLFDPRAFTHCELHDWVFEVGDADRCEDVRGQGDAWCWESDPGERPNYPKWIAPDYDLDDIDEATAPAKIRWNGDPTLVGFQGKVGTIADIHAL